MLKPSTNNIANNRKYPEWIVLISSISKEGRPNIMVAGWCMCTSHTPLMYAVSVAPQRYTHTLLSEVPEFVLAAPKFELAKATLFAGTNSGRQKDKIKEGGFEIKPASQVKPYLISGCVFNMECRIVESITTGDHTLFAGEVVQSHVDDDSAELRLMNFGGSEFAKPIADYQNTFKF
ncbi:MAG: flavin reductase family protein [bacterium]